MLDWSTMTVANAVHIALQHHSAGRLAEAEEIYQQALRIEPNNINALHLLGVLAIQTGSADAAIDLIGMAIKLNPHVPDMYGNLGAAFQAKGLLDEAVASYERALKINPDYAEAHYNLGNALKALGKLGDATVHYEQALAIKPDYTEACNNLGLLLQESGHPEAAIIQYQRALEINPCFAEAQNNLANALRDQGRLEEAVACYHQALKLRPDFVEAHSNLLFTLNAIFGQNPDALFEEHRNFARIHAKRFPNGWLPHSNDRNLNRKLKIGYVSPDFREHPVAYFIEPVFAHCDSAQFEVFGYYNYLQDDQTTALLKGYCQHWRDIGRMSDEQIAHLIKEDGIDILVDLAGHTSGNRILVFARKPAPVQVSWLGYPNTTGIQAIDYRITDNFADPAGRTENYYTETLVRLPGSFLCYTPSAGCPEFAVPPFSETGRITFGSFNNFAKVTPEVIALWARILRTVPGSRLMLKHSGLDEPIMQLRVLALFAEHGVDESSLELFGRTPSHFAHMQCYNKVDISLDPFPYNGTTTTCEALWMGVPVITLAGDTHVSRVGVSLLNNTGFPELIANTPEEYVEIAAGLAAKPDLLKQMRASLRQRMAASPLLNAEGFTRNIEAAYRDMWGKWRATSNLDLAVYRHDRLGSPR